MVIKYTLLWQIVELTGRTADDALVALHDSDYDLNGAVEQLLENENDQVSYIA